MKKALISFIALFLFSCNVQKRHYQKGYFVSWHKHSSTSIEKKEKITQQAVYKKQIQSEIILEVPETKPEVFASTSNELNRNYFKKNRNHLGIEDSCDVLIFKDGSELSVKITEISSSTIKYKKCSMIDGPVYISNKTELFMIKYANGTREVIKTQESNYNPSAQNKNPKQRPYKKNTKLSTGALIFAILGFYPLIIAGGIVAIITSSIQLYKIKLYPDLYGAERKALLSLIMGITSVILWGVIILSIVFLV